VTRAPTARWQDLAATVVLVLAALLAIVVPIAGWARTTIVLPAVLFAPGYAISAALFRPGEISREYRVVLSIALGVSAVALSGLLVQVVLALDRPVFATLVALITLGACAIAFNRRWPGPLNATESHFRPRSVGLTSALAIVAAVALAIWGIDLTTQGVDEQLMRSHFSSLWMIPSTSGGSKSAVRIDVSNHEGRSTGYRLLVKQGTRVVTQWRFRLESEREWRATLTKPAESNGGALTGSLYRNGVLDRRVKLKIGGIS
jgi:uncharacterized membrane protein